MSTNIDQIKSKVFETNNQLEKSRELSSEEKMLKAREIENTIFQIKTDLDSLKVWATAEDIKKIEALELEYENLQIKLNEFKQELDEFEAKLKEDILKEEKEPEEKNKKKWLWRQFESITSKEEWKNNPAKNTARIAWWIWALWLWSKIIKWIASLFKKKDKSESGQTSSEKKPRYKKWWWVGLIWVGWFLWIRRLMTGKNPVDWGWPWLSDKPEKQLWSYIDLYKNSPDQFEKYQKTWENTNIIYSKVYDKEIKSWWNDSDSLWKIWLDCVDEVKDADPNKIYSWLVPYIMDKNFSSVWKTISPEWLKYQEWSWDIDYLKTKILSRGKHWISNILWPFLWSLKSWVWLWDKSWESIDDKFSRWAETGDKEDRLKELQFFFRQYMKVNTYLICKKDEITISIAKEKFWEDPSWFSSFEDAIEDNDWFKKNIEKDDRYKKFISWKISDVSENIESAWVSSTSLSDEITEQVDELDDKREKILHWDWEKDILDVWQNDIDSWNLTSWTIWKLDKSCDNMLDDIKDEVEDAVKDSCWDPYSELFNTAWINKETFIENSWLEELFGGLKKSIKFYQTKIKAWNISKEEYAEFKNLTNQYFAMKKEMVIWSQTLQEINKDWKWRRVAWFLRWCLGNLWKSIEKFYNWNVWEWFKYLLTGIAPFIVIREWYLCFARKWHWIKRIKQVGGLTIWLPKKIVQSNFWIAKQINGRYVWSPRVLRATFFSWADWPDKMLRALSNVDRWVLNRSKISLDKAAEIIENWKYSKIIDHKIRAKWRVEFPQANKNLIKRGIIQKMIPWVPFDNLDLIVKYYDNKTLWYLVRNWDNSSILKLKSIDNQIAGLSKLKQNFILETLNKHILNFDQVDDLVKNIDKLDINKISSKNLSRWLNKGGSVSSVVDDLAKSVWKNVDNIDSVNKTKFTKIIDEEIKSMRGSFTWWDRAKEIMDWNIKRLNKFKESDTVTKESIETFMKLESKWIKPRHFPDISDWLKQDQKLVKALESWDFNKFSRLAKNNKSLKNVDNIINSFTSVLKKSWRYIDDIAYIIKGIWRIAKLI